MGVRWRYVWSHQQPASELRRRYKGQERGLDEETPSNTILLQKIPSFQLASDDHVTYPSRYTAANLRTLKAHQRLYISNVLKSNQVSLKSPNLQISRLGLHLDSNYIVIHVIQLAQDHFLTTTIPLNINMSYSTATTPRTSIELAKETITSSASVIPSTSSSSKTRGIWTFIKRYAKEHHDGVNAAFAAYYGQGEIRKAHQEIWEYKRGGKN
jgi:hypothetical protein